MYFTSLPRIYSAAAVNADAQFGSVELAYSITSWTLNGNMPAKTCIMKEQFILFCICWRRQSSTSENNTFVNYGKNYVHFVRLT